MAALPTPAGRRVRVDGREEVGIVVDEGKNIGSGASIYCVGVYFPSSGEVAYYEKGREQTQAS